MELFPVEFIMDVLSLIHTFPMGKHHEALFSLTVRDTGWAGQCPKDMRTNNVWMEELLTSCSSCWEAARKEWES